jgi:hypothetical protein
MKIKLHYQEGKFLEDIGKQSHYIEVAQGDIFMEQKM